MDFRSNVLLIDKDELTASGICELLSKRDNLFNVRRVSSSMQEAKLYCTDMRPDIVIFNMSLLDRGCVQTARQIKRLCPEICIMGYFPNLSCSVVSYVLFSKIFKVIFTPKTNINELMELIYTLEKEQNNLNPASVVAEEICSFLKESPQEMDAITSTYSILSKKEVDVFIMLLYGHRNKDIATLFTLSPKTISSHRSRIFKKLGAQNISEVFNNKYTNSSRRSLIKMLRQMQGTAGQISNNGKNSRKTNSS